MCFRENSNGGLKPSEHVNVLTIFPILNYFYFILFWEFTKVVNLFHGETLGLLTVTRIHSIRKSAKNRNSKVRWNPRWEAIEN